MTSKKTPLGSRGATGLRGKPKRPQPTGLRGKPTGLRGKGTGKRRNPATPEVQKHLMQIKQGH